MARRSKAREADERPAAPYFEVCVAGIPVSAQSKSPARLAVWKARVRAAAMESWPDGVPPLDVDVALHVTHYCEFAVGDTDNLIKPVQDALQGVVYVNDRQVKDGLSNRRNIDGRFRVRFMWPQLAAAFSRGEEFIHIRVSLSPETEELG